jgi:hypothetical protein
MKIKNTQSLVQLDQWQKAMNFLRTIFSRAAEINPPLSSTLDDTLYNLRRAPARASNRFFVLVNVTCLITRLIKQIENTKFLIAFSPDLFWDNMASVDNHFKIDAHTSS